MTDDLPQVRSHAERVRVRQGWALIFLGSLNLSATLVLLFERL